MQLLPTISIIKGDKFNQNQCPQNALKNEQVSDTPYTFAVDSLIYTQVCTRLGICNMNARKVPK
jgi:hypothetical protein